MPETPTPEFEYEYPPITLELSDREALTLFRAALEYLNAMRLIAIAQTNEGDEVVREEIERVDAICERISLAAYYPERLYAGPQ